MTKIPSYCLAFEDKILATVNDIAEPHIYEEVHSHIASCTRCAATYAQLQQVIAPGRPQKDPGSDFWDSYYDKLEARIALDKPEVASSPLRAPVQLVRLPKWSLQVAAAVIILVTGIWIGQSYFIEPAPEQVANSSSETELETQALSYLDRTKTLLLGLANFNPEEDDPADLDIDRRRTIAGGLIQEASLLKTELSKADQDRLSDLIADLEVILLQIANLESEYDIPEIEMVQNGVDRKAIFFKIDVENMLRTNREPQQASTPVRPKHSAI
ncbi:hypothetical protein HQ496_11330 [bacterium]|nr:hypothetical protein [bacterium]